MKTKKYIYKITYPNGKIYVGQDVTGTLNYFGSSKNPQIEKDYSEAEMKHFTIIKEIIWESNNATNKEVYDKEMKLIEELEANNPAKGYNLSPKYKASEE
jgi:hypothetical protein